jgi:hypothetical protein
MTDETPRPGSREEAAARRDVGKGPFSVEKAYVANKWLAAQISDCGGRPFAYVMAVDCVGGDFTAAKARATRIAEALNRAPDAVVQLVRAARDTDRAGDPNHPLYAALAPFASVEE